MDAEDTDRNLQWELGNALAVVEQLIDDLPEDRREQCLTAARRAAAELDAVAADLPRQVIHGDLTADNVMRDRRGRHWVIDLGDVATSWRAAELAMLLADLMGRTDDLAIVARAVAGFDQRARLTDAEIEALWPSSCCAGGARRQRVEPAAHRPGQRLRARAGRARMAGLRAHGAGAVRRGDGAAAPGRGPAAPRGPRLPSRPVAAGCRGHRGSRHPQRARSRSLDGSRHRAGARPRPSLPPRSRCCATARAA
jgi:hypothetical protein